MTDVNEHVVEHEGDIEEFDLLGFYKNFNAWRESIDAELKESKYDMNLLCIREVLTTVYDMVRDNTIIKSDQWLYDFCTGDKVVVSRNSDRTKDCSYLCKVGVLTGKHKANDLEVEFEDGTYAYIWQNDLDVLY